MKGLIIYHNKYSITREYAEHIANVTHLPVMSDKEVLPEDLDKVDFVVIGCQEHFHHLNNEKFLHNYEKELSTKKIFLYTASNFMQKAEEVRKDCSMRIPDSMIGNTTIFNFGNRDSNSEMTLGLQMGFSMGMMSAPNIDTLEYMEDVYDNKRYSEAEGLIKNIMILSKSK
jgi:hypothetical protein